jgi:hypothetical protein
LRFSPALSSIALPELDQISSSPTEKEGRGALCRCVLLAEFWSQLFFEENLWSFLRRSNHLLGERWAATKALREAAMDYGGPEPICCFALPLIEIDLAQAHPKHEQPPFNAACVQFDLFAPRK